jgi:hypothetical protein
MKSWECTHCHGLSPDDKLSCIHCAAPRPKETLLEDEGDADCTFVDETTEPIVKAPYDDPMKHSTLEVVPQGEYKIIPVPGPDVTDPDWDKETRSRKCT